MSLRRLNTSCFVLPSRNWAMSAWSWVAVAHLHATCIPLLKLKYPSYELQEFSILRSSFPLRNVVATARTKRFRRCFIQLLRATRHSYRTQIQLPLSTPRLASLSTPVFSFQPNRLPIHLSPRVQISSMEELSVALSVAVNVVPTLTFDLVAMVLSDDTER